MNANSDDQRDIGAPTTNDPIRSVQHATTLRRFEVLTIAVVLAVAYKAVPCWIVDDLLHGYEIYRRFGDNVYANLWYLCSVVLPLLLCLCRPSLSGLVLGTWGANTRRTIIVCLAPVIFALLLHPFIPQSLHIIYVGGWLISPVAQELFFSGFLYGFLTTAFPTKLHPRLTLNQAALLTAAFFSLWHVGSFESLSPGLASFRLFYTFLWSAWILMPRIWTGSILPGILAHMAVNFFA